MPTAAPTDPSSPTTPPFPLTAPATLPTMAQPPTATHRICWRSTPVARRKRRMSRTMPAIVPANIVTRPAPPRIWGRGLSAGSANGLDRWRYAGGSSAAGLVRTPTAPQAMPTRTAPTNGRHRGEGNEPAGSSSSGRATPSGIATIHEFASRVAASATRESESPRSRPTVAHALPA